ncbi:MAG: alpha-ketoacid dehydrogenase subunit beta [Thermus sp.]|uniref:alpha-ketoacid dehydrogenase subunit beta n=1 Tax=Thermus sp. TaxID=275 RepID=UPI0025CE9506|nr:alpha-ketoacid dehydrogenase subunit beta [Thermus sp.]MCS6867765.1 alpha-ketoacid dehydrogenase subunit beta [Thermus sp.]MCS7219529.1 alpha-ketoacid dehydrogenase subunit beta [Thermus sp.]MDW8017995.1 alpha-ketoacid dehydrogenase subunit beta [Thermus sp.]MDW8357904.1 alpha-ketoacid dehydrogenase subunit beta [Thermus sp.]
MREITFAEATREAMEEEMARDPAVFLMGEDIAKQGGIFGQFKGLAERFGLERVRDTPISEPTLVGAALGAALVGARPVLDIHFADFLLLAMDELINQAASLRYMSGGKLKAPLVIRAPDGAIRSAAAHHSKSLEGLFLHLPGLKVAAPATPRDAKGLLKASIRADDPVIYLEHKALYSRKGPVPEEEYTIPLGQAEVVREGKDLTLVSYGLTLHKALQAAQALEAGGVSAEVVDLKTLYPIDWETLLASAERTGRVVVAHETWRFLGPGAEIAATLEERLWRRLRAPVARVGAAHVPIPFSPPLERRVIPQVEDILRAAREVLSWT